MKDEGKRVFGFEFSVDGFQLSEFEISNLKFEIPELKTENRLLKTADTSSFRLPPSSLSFLPRRDW
jgi:hypothetical protein